MRIGLVNQFRGRPGAARPAPTWPSIHERVAVAEAVGFDMFVFEDALLYRGAEKTEGGWESMAVAAAIAASTRTIEFGQSVVNSPYRSPALVAKTAKTIDEISGGRYVLGIGAGGTDDADYEAFGFPTDHRFSRFAEAIEIIHTLITTGRIDFAGTFYTAHDTEIVLTGPRPHGPPINIAARGPRMLALTARYADAWNWWESGPSLGRIERRLAPLVSILDRACEEGERDPASLKRTLDLYTVVPDGFSPDDLDPDRAVTGSSEQIADFVLRLGEIGFDEVRCDVYPPTADTIEAMRPIVELVHRG